MLVFYSNILGKIDNLLHYENCYFNCKFLISNYLKNKLYQSNDGNDLTLTSTVPSQNFWINMTNNFIGGHDFINYIKLRINALSSRVRVYGWLYR